MTRFVLCSAEPLIVCLVMHSAFPATVYLRRLVPLLIGAYGVFRLTHAEHWDLLDDVNLAVHEAGHVVFQAFGEPTLTLGGSLFQLLLPIAFVIYFARRRDDFAAAVVTAWVGVSALNVARYIGDARAQDLPLLGGENTVHDWWYLLTEWGALAQDQAIARWVTLIGAACLLVATVGSLVYGWPVANREGERV